MKETTPIPKAKIISKELEKLIFRINKLIEEEWTITEIGKLLDISPQIISNIKSQKLKYSISLDKINQLNKRYEEIFPNQ